MDQASDRRSRDPESRVADILGGIGLYFLFLGLVQFLWVEHPDMASQVRGGLLTLLTGGGFLGAMQLLSPNKDGLPRAPRTASALGLLSWAALLLGLIEFGRAYHLPPSDLSALVLGWIALWTGQALESGLLGLAGAYLLHGHLNQALGLRLGLAGSLATTHVFLGLALAILFVLLGRWKVGRGFRTEGLALAGYGSLYAVSGLYLLSRFGEHYHGLPGHIWIAPAYLLVFLVACALLLGLAKELRSGALAVIPTMAIYLRALQSYAEWRGRIPEAGVYISLGILLLALAMRSEGSSSDAEGPRQIPLERQHQLLRRAWKLALALLLLAAFRGRSNQSELGESIHLPLECRALSPVVFLDVDPFAIEYPHGLPGGQELDVYLQTWKLEDGGQVRFGRGIATLPGAGIPTVLDPRRCFRFPGRMVRCRLLNGIPVEFVLPQNRSLFELPRDLWGAPTEGQELTFRVGRLGFPVPGELVPAPEG